MSQVDDMTKIRNHLLYHFGGDRSKVLAWIKEENYFLGGATPEQLIRAGKAKIVLQHIAYALLSHTGTEGDEE